MIKDNIDKEIDYCYIKEREIQEKIDNFEIIIKGLKTPKEILENYNNLISLKNLRNNQKKKVIKRN